MDRKTTHYDLTYKFLFVYRTHFKLLINLFLVFSNASSRPKFLNLKVGKDENNQAACYDQLGFLSLRS